MVSATLVGYYVLKEAQGAPQANDTSGKDAVPLVPAGSGAAVVFGAEGGPTTDGGLTCAAFSGGKRLSGLYGITLLAGVTSVTIEAFFTTSTAAQQQRIVALANGGGAHVPGADVIALGVDQTTGVLRGGFGVAGVNVITSTSPSSVADGNLHHAAYRATISGGNVTGTLWLDGVQVDTDTAASAAFPTTIDTIHVGGDPGSISGELHFTGTIAHAAIHASTIELADARISDHAEAGFTGFAGELPGARIARYLSYAGIPADEIN